MLIEKKPVAGDIVSLRLISGEEIIGRLSLSTDSNVTKITKPIIVSLQMLQNNQASIAFYPFMASVPDDIAVSFLNNALIISPIKARTDVANRYIEATSDIEVVPNGILGL